MESESFVEILVVGEPPRYQKPGDAGMDLSSTSALTLAPLQRALVPTGVSIALPAGYVGWVTPRSGLALRHGISMVNAPGIIDAGYRGEIQVILWNTDPENSFDVAVGDRIAQLIITPFSRAMIHQVDSLPGSMRDTGGFGSTGIARGEGGKSA